MFLMSLSLFSSIVFTGKVLGLGINDKPLSSKVRSLFVSSVDDKFTVRLLSVVLSLLLLRGRCWVSIVIVLFSEVFGWSPVVSLKGPDEHD